MKINADLSQRVVLHTEDIPWLKSPMVGVERQMLDRDGEEIARATSVVRYAANSYFSAHTHGGGEEFLVLEGIFSDEYGDYGPGTYVRNPAGSSHIPYSQEGCTIFVKLWQMDSQDQERVVVFTTRVTWLPGNVSGQLVLPLHSFGNERVALMTWSPGSESLAHNQGGEEILVLEGTLADEFGVYPKGTWVRNPPNFQKTTRSSPKGCLAYVKTGHLSPIEIS